MFNKQAKSNAIELKWRALKLLRPDDAPEKITYEKIKPVDEDLKSFLTEERARDCEIFLDFIIDGVDFAFWLNLNYYTQKFIGLELRNNICYGFNNRLYNEVNFYYQKIVLRRILGQLVTLEDAIDYKKAYRLDYKEEDIRNEAKELVKDENQNTMLYCSGCCGDRLCGYFGIRVYQTESEVVWFINLMGKHKIRFPKEEYFEAFSEYLDLVNDELALFGAKQVTLDDKADVVLPIDERVTLIQTKYQIKEEHFDKETLIIISKSGDIEEIDTGIYLANSLGFDIEALKNELEDTYNALPKNEQNSLSWKILDNSEYFNSIELYYPNISRKAYLLYS